MKKIRISIDDLLLLLQGLLRSDVAFRLIFSEPRDKKAARYRKVTARQVHTKQGVKWNIACWDGKQEIHQNISSESLLIEAWLKPWLEQFRQLQVQASQGDFHVFSNNDGTLRMLKRHAQHNVHVDNHDRGKNYLLREGEAAPFLVELGVMNAAGKVVKARYDKFRQINRYLEIVEDILPHLSEDKPLRVVDFGCGRSYLTFALHWLLTVYHRRKVDIIGLDLKEDVIAECSALAQKLSLSGLRFAVGDIAAWQTEGDVDLVVSLHACDTATDAALAQALRWHSRVILAAPCCQHQVAPQLRAAEQVALLKHGILRERLGALVTDALRAAALEALGYKCQVMEFIDLEHTPKNLLFRAIRGDSGSDAAAARQYAELKHKWCVENFALEELIDPEKRAILDNACFDRTKEG